MGGRGTFAAGNPVAYTYETVGKIEGVKILSGLGNKHDLPVEAHSSEAYIQLYPDGNFKMIRFYDKQHYIRVEVAYHPETALRKNFCKLINCDKNDVMERHKICRSNYLQYTMDTVICQGSF